MNLWILFLQNKIENNETINIIIIINNVTIAMMMMMTIFVGKPGSIKIKSWTTVSSSKKCHILIKIDYSK